VSWYIHQFVVCVPCSPTHDCSMSWSVSTCCQHQPGVVGQMQSPPFYCGPAAGGQEHFQVTGPQAGQGLHGEPTYIVQGMSSYCSAITTGQIPTYTLRYSASTGSSTHCYALLRCHCPCCSVFCMLELPSHQHHTSASHTQYSDIYNHHLSV